MSKAPKAVVIGRVSTSLLGMTRAIGEIGYDVISVKTVQKLPKPISWQRIAPQFRSKYVIDYTFISEKDRESLIEFLKKRCKSKGEKTLILPTDDFSAETIDMYYNELKEDFLMPNVQNKQGGVVRLMDKGYQKQLAEKVGLNVTKCRTITIEDGKFTLPDDIEYPVFVKPATPIPKRKSFMGKCDSIEDLRKYVSGAAKLADCDMLAEEYLEIDEELCFNGFSDSVHAQIPGIYEMAVGGTGSHSGVTVVGRLVPFSKYEEYRDAFTRFVESLNFTGIFDIDVIKSGGKLYFNELNLRQGASGYAFLLGGANFAKMLSDALHGNYEFSPIEIKPLEVVNERIALDEFSHGSLSWDEYRRLVDNTQYGFMKCESDKKPQKYFAFEEKRAKIKAKK